MLIKYIRITPLQFPLKKPYVWAQGVEESFIVNLIEFEAEDGTIGYGETMTAPDATAQKIVLKKRVFTSFFLNLLLLLFYFSAWVGQKRIK